MQQHAHYIFQKISIMKYINCTYHIFQPCMAVLSCAKTGSANIIFKESIILKSKQMQKYYKKYIPLEHHGKYLQTYRNGLPSNTNPFTA